MAAPKPLTIFIALCFSIAAQAQKGLVKGMLKDSASKQTLSLASITVFDAKDTTVITYRLSDPLGAFQIPGIPLNTTCRVVITFQGHKVYRKEFLLTKESPELNMGTVFLADDPKSLEEILITAERPPMQVRNDTLEFNATAFKTLPSAMVEDLLKKLPGVDVDLEGNITVRGRKVNRLLVDGKEFFGGDHKVASRNLPANIVDKVQVVDDKEELDANPLLSKDEVGQVVNIKLKRSIKQGWFGKAYAGGGTDSRHEAGAIVNLFRDTAQISVLGYSNNVNKPGFSIGDLQNIGGFNRSGTSSMSVSSGGGFSVNGSSFGGGGQGIQQSRGGGFNFNNVYGKKLTANFQYFFGGVNEDYQTISNVRRFIKDTVLTTPANYTRTAYTGRHQIGGSLNWKIDSVTTLTFRPSLNRSRSDGESRSESFTDDNFKGLVNRNTTRGMTGGDNTYYNHSLYFNRGSRKKRGRSLTFTSTVSLSENESDNQSEGLITFLRRGLPIDSLIEQLQLRNNVSNRIGASVNYTEPLSKKLSLTLSHRADYQREESVLDFYTRDIPGGKYSAYNEVLSNAVWRTGWQNTTSAATTFRLKKLTVTPGVSFFGLDNAVRFSKNPDVDRHFFFVYPTFNLNWNGWRLSYDAYISDVSATNLQRVIDLSSPLYKQYGNPDLRPSYSRNVNFGYFKYFQKSGSSFNINLNASWQKDAVLRQTFLDSNRVTISRPVNISGMRNYNLYVNYNKQYKFSKDLRFSIRPWGNAGYNRNFVFINGEMSEAFYTRASVNLAFLINYKDKIEWNQSYNNNVNRSSYANKKAFRDQEIITHSAESELIVRWPKHLVWESLVNYMYNPQVSPGFRRDVVRWNAGVNYVFLREDKGQLKLSVYDLLKQNTSVYRYTGESTISDVQTNTLQRYFLLSFIYNIRAFSTGQKVGGRDRTFGFW